MSTLSDKILVGVRTCKGSDHLKVENVKDFIKKIKSESICKDCSASHDTGCDCEDQIFLVNTRLIDLHAGEKLI